MVSALVCTFVYFFFFQAEDGIRDYKVTGVQTCALPISPRHCGVATDQRMSGILDDEGAFRETGQPPRERGAGSGSPGRYLKPRSEGRLCYPKPGLAEQSRQHFRLPPGGLKRQPRSRVVPGDQLGGLVGTEVRGPALYQPAGMRWYRSPLPAPRARELAQRLVHEPRRSFPGGLARERHAG